MGYLPKMFEAINKLTLLGNNILDVGSQDLIISSASELLLVNQFISRNNSAGKKIDLDQFPTIIEAKEVYIRAGFNYTCIDVDERPYIIRVDLASFEIPRKFRNTFDLVVNVGTTEHLSSPVAAFALMHEMCKKGGIIYNDVPVFGLGNHGLINPTPKFWHAMIWMNQYSVKHMAIRQEVESNYEKGNFYHDYLSYMKGLKNIKNISYIINSVLEKQTNFPFVIPYDAVFPNTDGGESLASLMLGSYHPFLKTGAYSSEEVSCAINHFLEMNDKTYRIELPKEIAHKKKGFLASLLRQFKVIGNDK